jgi:predicted DNA-binding transcriptional regulator AlpA
MTDSTAAVQTGSSEASGNGSKRLTRLPKEQHAEDQTSPEPLLLKAMQAAAICGKSLRTWRTWDAAGWIPRPVRIGRSTLWRADELREWVAAGCPRRAEWEARQCR